MAPPAAAPMQRTPAPASPAALQALADALGLVLQEAQSQRLLAYLALLQRWNRVYNLTALREPGLMFSHHLADCLAVLPPLLRFAAGLGGAAAAGGPSPALRILDVGSGGGLPGVVLAIMQPAWQVDCVDAVAKKATFVRQVAAELGLGNLQGLHARVEMLGSAARRYDIITSRAFASLADFTRLTTDLLAPGGVWLAMKARLPAAEQAELPADVTVFHVEQLQVPGLDAERCLVWLRRSTGPAAGAGGPGQHGG